MNYRYMRVIVFFDLPTETAEDKKEYRDFRKFLIKKGFMMLQESVYCKLALNMTVADAIVQSVKSSKPKAGLVQLLVITEKQFNKMEFIVGSAQNTVIDSDERLVIL
jgi:CRISPR-associated protein Cas2